MDETKYNLTEKEMTWIVVASMVTGAVFGVNTQLTEEEAEVNKDEILEMMASPNAPGARVIRGLAYEFMADNIQKELDDFRAGGNRFDKWFRPLNWDKPEPPEGSIIL